MKQRWDRGGTVRTFRAFAAYRCSRRMRSCVAGLRTHSVIRMRPHPRAVPNRMRIQRRLECHAHAVRGAIGLWASKLLNRCKMSVMAKAGKAATVKRAGVDPFVATLLGKIKVGKQELSFRKGDKIFSQGDIADSIYFIQTGRIKIAVVSAAGKEAVLAMPGPHDFFGEGSLVNQPLRMSTAKTLEPSTVFRVCGRREKRQAEQAEHGWVA